MFMIVTFQTKAKRNKAVSNQLVKDWFKTFKHWNGDGASLSRLVWLKVRGMPLNVWNLKSFQRICENWGEFITLDEEIVMEESYDIGRMLMVTNYNSKIDQWINILGERQNLQRASVGGGM